MERLTKFSNDIIRNNAITVLRKLNDKNGLNEDELAVISAFCLIERVENKKLKEYEDLEQQGLLPKLPCKVGDTVWELCKCDDGIYRIFPMKVTQVIPYGSVRWVKGKEPTVWNIYAVSDYTDMYKSFYDFGKTVFLTQAEAEEALKRMEREE